MYSEIKDAYFAGLMDGEGHMGFSMAGGRRQAIVQVKMASWETIEALQLYFGGSVQIVKSAKSHHLQQWKWRVRLKAVIPVLERVRPYLITKAKDADLVLNAPRTPKGNPLFIDP